MLGISESTINNIASQIKEQLKDVDEEDIKNRIKEMVGSDDQDVIDTCGTLIGTVVNAVSKNETGGLDGLVNSITGSLESVAPTLDKNKMGKTVGAFTKYLNENQGALKNMKDKDGNPINNDLMKSLETPLKLINKLASGKNIDPSEYKQMMNVANQMKNMRKK